MANHFQVDFAAVADQLDIVSKGAAYVLTSPIFLRAMTDSFLAVPSDMSAS